MLAWGDFRLHDQMAAKSTLVSSLWRGVIISRRTWHSWNRLCQIFNQGYLSRLDRTTGESVFISPNQQLEKAKSGFNWDAPILPKSNAFQARFTFASHREYGKINWPRRFLDCYFGRDLTSKRNDLEQPIMGQNSKLRKCLGDVYAIVEFQFDHFAGRIAS